MFEKIKEHLFFRKVIKEKENKLKRTELVLRFLNETNQFPKKLEEDIKELRSQLKVEQSKKEDKRDGVFITEIAYKISEKEQILRAYNNNVEVIKEAKKFIYLLKEWKSQL